VDDRPSRASIDALAALDAFVDPDWHSLAFHKIKNVHRAYIDAVLLGIAQILVDLDGETVAFIGILIDGHELTP
jgi:hypothetical protein